MIGFFLGSPGSIYVVCGLLLLCLLCSCVYIHDGLYIWVFSLTSGLSARGVVVRKVGLPLMFLPGRYGLASF